MVFCWYENDLNQKGDLTLDHPYFYMKLGKLVFCYPDYSQ
ncbi:conserved hypothetical protein [Xenorhabdus nematophila F1]|uniref:Uncharacterized protein n=1 Tax=Xenorhabdus nematophila (strain ATCC 19061 / DSM 3370 / CCUG 14189 / LMG 1036 / NCIMB 9965 / AN6) TaxID=406817 RepID=D3V9S0_XENNA|nr:hypothetical protein XNC1_1237 [Xenorhabdus nematophila ATCC 19061]CCW30228.1 conserved hypothetical protein [Xenorhabdus nematophila F1]CEE95155.1 hypothetical protein XNA1_4990003 [Xenorhabdus nematophila str. Anatoliense]CEF29284.1 hypothetical protein XNW1_1660031 [Xenorhabdus nematophila str. Websteri]CEK22209.1 hypothetical protein XNC2_1213 [Xenorhabdus nematophila AN6/1]